MPIPPHLTIDTKGLNIENLLSDWRWLVNGQFTPVVMNVFGDLFLSDNSGGVYFLDLMCGEFKQVATSKEEFESLCENKDQRQSWFVGYLAMELRKIYGQLEVGQCYGCKIPLSLGGQLEPSNFERTDIEVHFSVLGQLHQKTKHLPPGTKINSVKIEPASNEKQKKSWWQKLVGGNG
jgi:hypothetical protein